MTTIKLFVLAAVLGTWAQSNTLAQAALKDVVGRGAPILGTDKGCSSTSPTCNWMKKLPDSTKLVSLNLAGMHDAATWNYSQATQDSLKKYTGPDIAPAKFFRCHEQSIFTGLNRGVRVFDLRFAYNPGLDTIGFWHSAALLSPTTTIEDVFFGFYSWLDKHPSEAVFIMINHEGGTGTPYDAKIQQHMYDLFTSDLAKKYWVQSKDTLGTLASARGKLTLLQRFDYNLLSLPSPNPHGIYLSGGQWGDNRADVTVTYNPAKNQRAFIEDYYEVITPQPNSPAYPTPQTEVQWKFNATTAHLLQATTKNLDQLYISFASARSDVNEGGAEVVPRTMAIGDGTVEGVNQKLVPWLKARKGKRFGIIMLDFFDTAPGLVEAIIGV